MKFYATTKKNEFMWFIEAWMKLKFIIPSKICQSKKNKCKLAYVFYDIYTYLLNV